MNFPTVAHKVQDPGRLEDFGPFPGADTDNQIAWDKRQDGLPPLPVLPHPNGLICGKKRFNTPASRDALRPTLILWNGKNRIPISIARGAKYRRVQGCLFFERWAYCLVAHSKPLCLVPTSAGDGCESPKRARRDSEVQFRSLHLEVRIASLT